MALHLADRLFQSARRGVMRDTAIYAIGNAAIALLPLAVLPILTRNLSIEEFGLYANIVAFVAVLVPFSNLGLSNVVARDYVHRSNLDYPSVVTTCTVISTVCILLIACGMFATVVSAPDMLASILGKASVPLVASALLILASQTMMPTLLVIYSMARRPFLYIIVRLVHAAIFAAAAIMAVVWLAGGGNGLIFAKAAIDTLLLCFCIFWLIRHGLLVLRISTAEGARCLVYALPLIPQMAAAASLGAADRMIITHLLGAGAAGIYSVGHQIGMVMWLVVNSTAQAWQPWFYPQMKEGTEHARRRVVRATYGVAAGWLVVATFFWVISPWIVELIVAESFYDAQRVTRWIIAGFLFQGLYSLASAYLYFSGRTGRLALAMLATAVVHVILTFGLTLRSGIDGAAQAVALAYLVALILVWIAAQSTTRMPWLNALCSGIGKSRHRPHPIAH